MLLFIHSHTFSSLFICCFSILLVFSISLYLLFFIHLNVYPLPSTCSFFPFAGIPLCFQVHLHFLNLNYKIIHSLSQQVFSLLAHKLWKGRKIKPENIRFVRYYALLLHRNREINGTVLKVMGVRF
jgi:hypothetical protein